MRLTRRGRVVVGLALLALWVFLLWGFVQLTPNLR